MLVKKAPSHYTSILLTPGAEDFVSIGAVGLSNIAQHE